MKETSAHILFNETEWENLVEFLRDCPGRICAAVVPGQLAGDALVERLPSFLDSIPLVVAPENASPPEIGHLAVQQGEKDVVLVVLLDGRRRFDSEEGRHRFWEAMNYQRESLAHGNIRTCFVLNAQSDRWMIQGADDLREWVHVFRFPEAVERRADLPLLMQSELSPVNWGQPGEKVPLEPLRDQLRRAREAGFSRDQLARDYAGPLFEALVRHGVYDEALRIWKDFLYDGEALDFLGHEERFWILRARVDLARRTYRVDDWDHWTHRLMEDANKANNKGLIANSEFERGAYLEWIDDLEGAREAYEQVLPIYRAIQDRLGEANCLWRLGELGMRVSDLEGAREAYEQALPIYRAIQNRLGEANCLLSLGDLRMHVSDLEGAREALEQALPIYRAIRIRLGEANCIRSLGDLRMRVDDLEGAREAYEQALPIYRAIQDRLGEANCLWDLGIVQKRASDPEGARKAHEQALPIFRALQKRLGEANCLLSLGDLRISVSDLEGAREAYEEALPIYRAIQDQLGEANCLQSMARLHLVGGKPVEAFRQFRNVLDVYMAIQNSVGVQTALGYMAQAAAAASEMDQALLLAERSLGMGRRIQDRYGQTITLVAQSKAFLDLKDFEGVMAALLILLELYSELNDKKKLNIVAAMLAKIENEIPPEARETIASDPESARLAAVERACQRFAATGRDLLDPPPDPEPSASKP